MINLSNFHKKIGFVSLITLAAFCYSHEIKAIEGADDQSSKTPTARPKTSEESFDKALRNSFIAFYADVKKEGEKGIEERSLQALKLLDKRSLSLKTEEKKHAKAICSLGKIFFFAKKYDEAKTWFTHAAKLNNPSAHNMLGWMHLHADMGGKQDFPEAIRCFEEASKLGHRKAKIHLAWRYINKEGVDGSKEALEKNALSLFKQAHALYTEVNKEVDDDSKKKAIEISKKHTLIKEKEEKKKEEAIREKEEIDKDFAEL